MSFSGNQYPNNAAKVITTRGDIVRGNSSGERERYGIGAANTVLTSDGTDPSWAAHGGVPTTTKGDISGFSTTQARIPVGTNNYTILADSAQALGLKYAASSTSTLTTAGDLLVASSANTLSRLARGSDNQVLTMNGTALNWETASGGGAATANTLLNSGSFSTDSTSFVDVTSFSLTLPTTAAASDDCLIMFSGICTIGTLGNAINIIIVDDTTEIVSQEIEPTAEGYGENFGLQTITDASGNTAKLQMRISGGAASTLVHNSDKNGILTAFAV